MKKSNQVSKFLKVVNGERVNAPPLWMMRQAGRYLPEYRALRQKAASFLDFCYTPEMAIEATLQPIQRFSLDAAIIFSDILVVPHALGQHVWFAEGEGPKLDAIGSLDDFNKLKTEIDMDHLDPVFQSLKAVRSTLSDDVALIGFCGAPWTVASYMIAGKSTPDQAPARLMAYQNPDLFKLIIDKLVHSSIQYLVKQLQSGADVVQIFESFGGALTPDLFKKWSVEPILRIIQGVRTHIKDSRIIVFAKGVGAYTASFENEANVIGIDWQTEPKDVSRYLSAATPVQGNLDPLCLVCGGTQLDAAVDHILNGFSNRPHIFNLGHGIVPQTPIAHVEQLIERVRAFKG